MKPNFHSHYVLCRIDGNPIPHIMENTDPYYDEIVIEQESCVVPYYLLKIKKDELVTLAMDIQKRQEKLRQEDEGKFKNKNKKSQDTNILHTSDDREIIQNSKKESRNVKISERPVREQKISDSSSSEDDIEIPLPRTKNTEE